uniref:Phosphoinositide-3-kinase adaptor protein 1 n=1 Tax=Poecilia latipinna TaxID=48699 RepID=A0A3B3V7R8_9TELE
MLCFAAMSEFSSAFELLILHTEEAQEWAAYLQQILKSSKHFRRGSVLLYAVSSADQLHGYNFEDFQRCKCIVVLLTGFFLDILYDPDLHGALHRLLYPPHRVVALLCGVAEADMNMEYFEDWPSWRKLYAELQSEYPAAESLISAAAAVSPLSNENPPAGGSEEAEPEEQSETFLKEEERASGEDSAGERIRSPTQPTCLTIQPSRVQCVTSLTLHADGSRVDLSPVTFYTSMGEVSRYLTQAADPVNFICQAFNLTSNSAESVDTLLTDSLKSRMPPSGLQLFGVKQIEEDNMSAYQRNEELPTLLHFAAKYGLKKLMSSLLRCPGALQAYSVMNKHGDYPNTLAEKSGFQDLRRFMDEFFLFSIITSFLNAFGFSRLAAKPHADENQVNAVPPRAENHDRNEHNNFDEIEEEEDPYNICPEDIYDTVDTNSTYNPGVQNRPPAPIPRPEAEPEPERPATYISRGLLFTATFLHTGPAQGICNEAPSSTYDPYGGMKTPGQRQLICLQERVKVGEITVDEAVQEFKAWQFDHERRANSLRYQQVDDQQTSSCDSKWWLHPLRWLSQSKEGAGRLAARPAHRVSLFYFIFRDEYY